MENKAGTKLGKIGAGGLFVGWHRGLPPKREKLSSLYRTVTVECRCFS